MAIITISRGSYSMGKAVAEKVAEHLQYTIITREVILDASQQFNIPEIKLVRAAGARPVLLVLPTDFDLGGGQPLPIHVRYREIIHEVGESEGVTVVDAVPTFNDLPVVGTFFIDSYHPAPMGARIIGQLIDEALGDQAP